GGRERAAARGGRAFERTGRGAGSGAGGAAGGEGATASAELGQAQRARSTEGRGERAQEAGTELRPQAGGAADAADRPRGGGVSRLWVSPPRGLGQAPPRDDRDPPPHGGGRRPRLARAGLPAVRQVPRAGPGPARGGGGPAPLRPAADGP